MLTGELKDRLRSVARLFSDAVKCLFVPRTVGRSIKLGDAADFKYRIMFATTAAAISGGLQALAFQAFGMDYLGSGWDSLLQLLQPVLIVFGTMLIYVPLRLMQLSKIPLSQFMQPQLMASGASSYLMPLTLLPALWYLYQHGTAMPESLAGTQFAVQYCGEKISNYPCLAGVMAVDSSSGSLQNAIAFVLAAWFLVMNLLITNAATGIAIWRLALAFIVMFVSVMFLTDFVTRLM